MKFSLSLFLISHFILASYDLLYAQTNSINNKVSSALIASLLEQAEEEKKDFHYEIAISCYEKILILNPNEKKANKELKLLHKLKENYNKELYHETKERMLSHVERKWKETNTNINSKIPLNSSEEKKDNATINNKVHSLMIPHIKLENVSVAEAVDYLKQKSREQDPLQKGINIFLKLPDSEASLLPSSKPPETLISLELNEVPLYVALDYVARQANLLLKIDPYAVALLPVSTPNDVLIVKEYEVPPHFFSINEQFLSNQAITSEEAKKCYQAKEYFESQGINFPPEASANYLPSSGKLIVRANQENLDLIDILVSAAKKNTPSQVSIETKFIEVSEDQMAQLGFSWLLGPLKIGNSGLSINGEGKTASLGANNNPLSVTSGNGGFNLNTPIDTAINNGSILPTTGTEGFNVSGIYSAAQLQVIIKALSQKKGIDVMAAPHVTTKSGLKATVKIVDEFIYPTEYSPPQIPQSTTNGGGFLNQAPPTITPAFPHSWATKNLGVILDAKPTIEPDGCTINLELHPQITDFDGFINYGTPINTIGYHALSLTNVSATPFSSTLTTNTINQPVFTVREVTTSVMVEDGQTIVLGGLIREDTEKVEDKIPLLGDIPFVGRVFQSKAEKKLKKNLIIFVTPKILHAD